MLIGREDDVARCLEILDSGASLAIVADAGVGKSALLREVGRRWNHVLVGRCLASMASVPLLCLVSALVGTTVEDARDLVSALVQATEGGALFLEDLHWADHASLALLPALVGRIPVLATVRADDPAAATTIDAVDAAGIGVHRLRPLSRVESLALVAQRRPDLSVVDQRSVVARAEGNPLLLEELSVDGAPSTALRVSVGARLDRLSPQGRASFELLATWGRPVTSPELGTQADELLAAGLVLAQGPALTPRHEVFAEVSLDRLSDPDRQRLHAEVAARTDDPAERARHLAASGRREEAHRIALDALARGDGPAARAGLLVLAARTAAPGDDVDGLLIDAAETLVAAGAWDDALTLLPDPFPGSRERAAEVLLVRAKALRGRDGPAAAHAPLAEGMALARGTGGDVEIRLLLEDTALRVLEWAPPSDAQAQRLLSLAEGTRFGPAAHLALGSTMITGGRREAIGHLRLAATAARATEDITTASEAALLLASALKAFGWWRLSLRIAEAAEDEAERHDLHGWATQLAFHRVYTLLDMAGDVDAPISPGARLIADRALPARLLDDTVGIVALAFVEAGRPAEAGDVLRSTRARGVSAFRAIAEAELALATEPPSKALAEIARLLEGLDDDPNAVILEVTHAYACLAAGVDLLPLGGRRSQHPFVRCYVEELAGLRAFSAGAMEDAASRFDHAAVLARRHEVRASIRCRWMAARSLGLAGRAGEACDRLLSLENETRTLGMERALGRIRSTLRELGVRRSAPRAASDGPLTGREHDVLQLVLAGRRTREIAAELGISMSTVETLVAASMRKLGAATRIEAAQRFADRERGHAAGDDRAVEFGTHPG